MTLLNIHLGCLLIAFNSDMSRDGTPLPNERRPSERMAHYGDDYAGR
jgi:hypothetical protein